MSNQFVLPLLEKMRDDDKDLRFMALNDLMAEFKKGLSMDERLEKKVVNSVKQLIEDNNGEVQNLAVKCLGTLVHHVQPESVFDMVEHLNKLFLKGEDQKRDIASIGIKTIITQIAVDAPVTQVVCDQVVASIIPAIADASTPDNIILECLDILTASLNNFGNRMHNHYNELQAKLLPLLKHKRAVIRKRATTAIAALMPYVSEDLFNTTAKQLLSELSSASNAAHSKAFITAFATISRDSGALLAPFVSDAIPLIMGNIDNEEEDDELTEGALQALESFVLHCGNAVEDHLTTTIDTAVDKLSYDPNYNDDDDDDDDEQMDTDEDDFDDDDDDFDDDYSDDDDMSWKVRRACAKLLDAIIRMRPDLLSTMYEKVAPKLVARFKEREETVRLDIFSTYDSLLEQTRLREQNKSADDMDADSSMASPTIAPTINKLKKQLLDKNLKVRQGAINVINSIAVTVHNGLNGHLSAILPALVSCFSDKATTTNVKNDLVSLTSVIVKQHDVTSFSDQDIENLCEVAIFATEDKFFKTAAKGLSLITSLLEILRADITAAPSAEAVSQIQRLTTTVETKFNASDADQEVKECAINCVSVLMSRFGDITQDRNTPMLQTFISRLENEVTRITATKAFEKLAASSLIDLSPVLDQAVRLMATFLRKTNRSLRLAALSTLKSTMVSQGMSVQPDACKDILNEVPSLISESEAQVAVSAIRLVSACITSQPDCTALLKDQIPVLPAVIAFVPSSVLQGASLDDTVGLLQSMASAGVSGMTVNDIKEMLMQHVGQASISKQSLLNVASAIASVVSIDQNLLEQQVAECLALAQRSDAETSRRAFAVFVVGKAGVLMDLSGNAQVAQVLQASLSDSSDDVTTAAAEALGLVAASNLEVYVPMLISGTTEHAKPYLYVLAIKVMLSQLLKKKASADNISATLWDVLIKQSENAEQTVRNIISECLGRIAVMDPSKAGNLSSALQSSVSNTRSTAASSIKTLIIAGSNTDDAIKSLLPVLLQCVNDADNDVRKASLLTLNSIMHTLPHLIADQAQDIITLVYKETVVRPELVREVEMGPFKHKIDDGANTRKAAYECMHTGLDIFPAQISSHDFLDTLMTGLTDEYDIQMLAFMMVTQVSQRYPNEVMLRIDAFVAALQKTIEAKLKNSAVKQEIEKMEELKKTAVRAIHSLYKISGSDKSPALRQLIEKVQGQASLQRRWQELEGIQSDITPMETSA